MKWPQGDRGLCHLAGEGYVVCLGSANRTPPSPNQAPYMAPGHRGQMQSSQLTHAHGDPMTPWQAFLSFTAVLAAS